MTLPEMATALQSLSQKYPTAEIYIEFLGGQITLGIPKGSVGDEFDREFGTFLRENHYCEVSDWGNNCET